MLVTCTLFQRQLKKEYETRFATKIKQIKLLEKCVCIYLSDKKKHIYPRDVWLILISNKQINIIHTCLYSDGNKDAHWQEHEQNMKKFWFS